MADKTESPHIKPNPLRNLIRVIARDTVKGADEFTQRLTAMSVILTALQGITEGYNISKTPKELDNIADEMLDRLGIPHAFPVAPAELETEPVKIAEALRNAAKLFKKYPQSLVTTQPHSPPEVTTTNTTKRAGQLSVPKADVGPTKGGSSQAIIGPLLQAKRIPLPRHYDDSHESHNETIDQSTSEERVTAARAPTKKRKVHNI